MRKKQVTQLTAHFTLEEFTQSSVAKKNRVNNTPNEEQVANIRTLCERILEPARQMLGEPITITSGYRCEVLNRLVGGVKNSQHKSGQAADLQCQHLRALFELLKNLGGFDQLLFERNKQGTQWVHISYRRDGDNREYVNDNYKA